MSTNCTTKVDKSIPVYYFLSERNSKLRRGSSRVLPFMIAVREKDDFGSTLGWILCAVDKRAPLVASPLEAILLARISLGSPEEVGLLVEMACLEELPFREVLPLSESNSTSLDEGTSSEVLCLEWSPGRPEPEASLLEKASAAPENFSLNSCPTEVLSGLSADGPRFRPTFPLGFRPLELAPI